MGGAVSSGRDNNELIDNLMNGKYIRTKRVERVFRALDRADYMTPEARDQAYKDLAWRNGPLHLSSPCIYSEVMEGLELKPGLSFLNVGSGTGYLSTLAGLILGTSGISHGVEVHPAVVEYAVKKIGQFLENSPVLDDFDFCEPKFFQGNGLCLTPLLSGYDRVYVGAGCPVEYEDYFKRLIKVGGILVMPLNETLLQVKRVGEDKWTSRSVLNVSFSKLKIPSKEEAADLVKLDKQTPVRLQLLSRAVVRCAMRRGVIRRNPELREKPRAPPRSSSCPRRICIPIEPGSAENLNVLHDLDPENGGNEMNALLSLVISMGHNRVAGGMRFDRIAEGVHDSSDGEDEDNQQPEARRPEDGPPSDAQTDEPRSDNDSGRPSNDSSTSGNDKTKSGNDTSGDSNSDSKRGGNSDSDDDKPNDKPRNKIADSKTVRQTRRYRRILDDPRLPANYRELLSYSYLLEEPSTSSRDASSTNEDLTDASEPRSDASADDRPGCSKDVRSGTIPPGVPSEVEIDLGVKMMDQATTSQMDWVANQTDTEEGSDDDLDDSNSKAKRQKLDSGLGETTPSGSSTDQATQSDSELSLSHTDDTESRRSVTPRPARRAAGAPTTGRSVFGSVEWAEEECPQLRAHAARRRRRIARGGDARRVRLSVLMKQAVRELPLPHALKKFVNLGRCFEF